MPTSYLEIKRRVAHSVREMRKVNMGPSTRSPFGGLYTMFHEYRRLMSKLGFSNLMGSAPKKAGWTGVGSTCKKQWDGMLRMRC